MSAEYGISITVGFVSCLMVLVSQLSRHFRIEPEATRKIVHVGSGLMAMALPWMFDSAAPVVAACFICAGFVAICRHTTLLPAHLKQVLGGVRRCSGGEYFFPLAIAILFPLSRGEVALYVIPVAILSFADTAAAVVGTRWGATQYFALAGRKSLEGSMAFLFVAAPVAALLLSILTDLGPGQVLVFAGWLAVATTLVEAISTRGTDNLTVPLIAFVVLTLLLGERDYGPWMLAVLVATPVLVLVWLRRRHGEIGHVPRIDTVTAREGASVPRRRAPEPTWSSRRCA